MAADQLVDARSKRGANFRVYQGRDAQGDPTLALDAMMVCLLTDIRDELYMLNRIRDELHTLNRLLGCRNFTTLPQTLRRLDRRLAKLEGLKLTPKGGS